jgi:hypothetical protein
MVILEKDGTTYYEIESKEGDKERDILYTNDGTIYEKEEAIPESELPAAVSDSIKTYHSGDKIKKVERITHKGRTQYEIMFENGKEVTLSEQGKHVKKHNNKKQS